ncbi:TPA: hypothetical protein PC598_003510 [Morganella morganii]|nr:hypothetical protein [Morganella morganii]
MNKLLRVMIIMLKAILHPDRIITKNTNEKDQKKQQESNTTDKFFVDENGSISLNPNSDVVRKALEDNVNKLKKIHGQASKCGQQ